MEADKSALRASLLATRRSMSARQRTAAGQAIADHLLAAPEVRAASSVAAYVGMGAEPPTLPLLQRLHEQGLRVLLPVLRADNDLDWADFTGEAGLGRARRGLLEPSGARLGVHAVTSAGVVLCPGLAVGRDGVRLGRGGGSYDRVLARIRGDRAGDPAQAWTCVLLFDGEVRDAVPASPHDQPVDAAVTPAGLVRLH